MRDWGAFVNLGVTTNFKMNRLIREYIIEKWWFATFVFMITIILAFSDIKIVPFYILVIFGILFLLIAVIIQLYNKKWKVGILNLGILFFALSVFGGLSLLLQFAGFGSDKDVFADNLKIPKNVKLEKPIDIKMDDNFQPIRPYISKTNTDFQLYNSFQPGVYEYDVWIESKESGIVFLKAYEITQEIELTSLYENTNIRINNTNKIIKKFSSKTYFIIYEGDWGKPYGARFEVWFIPDNTLKEEKILEKSYIIEGWQR